MEALKSFISLYLNWKSAEVLFISCSRFNFFNPGVCLGGALRDTRRSEAERRFNAGSLDKRSGDGLKFWR